MPTAPPKVTRGINSTTFLQVSRSAVFLPANSQPALIHTLMVSWLKTLKPKELLDEVSNSLAWYYCFHIPFLLITGGGGVGEPRLVNQSCHSQATE